MKVPRHVIDILAEASDDQLARWVDGYADSRNMPMLEAVQAEQWRRREVAA